MDNMKSMAIANTERAHKVLGKLLGLEAALTGVAVTPTQTPNKVDSLVHNTKAVNQVMSSLEAAVNRLTAVCGYEKAEKPPVQVTPRRRCRSKHAYKHSQKRDKNGQFATKK